MTTSGTVEKFLFVVRMGIGVVPSVIVVGDSKNNDSSCVDVWLTSRSATYTGLDPTLTCTYTLDADGILISVMTRNNFP
jgi:hypothetical protein